MLSSIISVKFVWKCLSTFRTKVKMYFSVQYEKKKDRIQLFKPK